MGNKKFSGVQNWVWIAAVVAGLAPCHGEEAPGMVVSSVLGVFRYALENNENTLANMNYVLIIITAISFALWFAIYLYSQWKPMVRRWSVRCRVAMLVSGVALTIAVGGKPNIPQSGQQGGMVLNVPTLLSQGQGQHAPEGWPWNNTRVATAIAGLEPTTNKFYRGLPQTFVDTSVALADIVSTNAVSSTNWVDTTIKMFSRDGAKERGVLVDVPFEINGQNAVGICVPPRVSIGKQHTMKSLEARFGPVKSLCWTLGLEVRA
ncbi:MAG: hypothetical protein FWF96_06805, partial [Kiritimatiellaeota bacterium]|nr:hypothetical protein [Kiritimatiellota bacterium]